MAQVIKTTFQLRRGLLEVWERNNPILAKGEPSFVLDKNALKIGDGVTPWKELDYIGLNQEDLAKAIEDYFKENPGSGTGADEKKYVKTINDTAPDENGNIVVKGEGIAYDNTVSGIDATTVQGAIDKLSGGMPDWNAAEGEPGHVLNRPFYSVAGTTVEILPETRPIYVEAEDMFITGNIPALTAGAEYTVNWNGTAYPCTASAIPIAEGIEIIVLGDVGMMENGTPETGEPFCIAVYPAEMYGGVAIVPLDGTTELVLSILGTGETVVPIPQKYLGDLRAQKKYAIDRDQGITPSLEALWKMDTAELQAALVWIEGGTEKNVTIVSRADVEEDGIRYHQIYLSVPMEGDRINYYRWTSGGIMLVRESWIPHALPKGISGTFMLVKQLSEEQPRWWRVDEVALPGIVLSSTTQGSSKKFLITADDNGALYAQQPGQTEKMLIGPGNGGNVDLTGYATEQWVHDQNYLTEVPEGFAKDEDIPTDDHIIELIQQHAPDSGGNVDLTTVANTMPSSVPAMGDNTTDDSEAIQALLDTEDYVYLPKGTYYIAKNPLKMTRDYCTFICDGTLIINTTTALELSASYCHVKIAHIKNRWNGSWTEADSWSFNVNGIKIGSTTGHVQYNTIEVDFIERCKNAIWIVPDGEGLGVAHNTIRFGEIFAEYGIHFQPGAAAFVYINANHFYGGRLRGKYPIYTEKGANQIDPFNGNNFHHIAYEGCQRPMTLNYFCYNHIQDMRLAPQENTSIVYPNPYIVLDEYSFGNTINTHATLNVDQIVDRYKTGTNWDWARWLGNEYSGKCIVANAQGYEDWVGDKCRSSHGSFIAQNDRGITAGGYNRDIDLSANKYAIDGLICYLTAKTRNVSVKLAKGYHYAGAKTIYLYIAERTDPYTVQVTQYNEETQTDVVIAPPTVFTETGMYKLECVAAIGWIVTKVDIINILPATQIPPIAPPVDPSTIKSMANWYDETAAGATMDTITSIEISNSYTASGDEDASWAVDVDGTGTIMAYRNGTNVTVATTNGASKIKLNSDSRRMFQANGGNYAGDGRFTTLSEISGTEIFVADVGTKMDNACSGNTVLTTPICIPKGVTSMKKVFDSCTALRTAPTIPNGVTDLASAFINCSALQALPDIPESVEVMDYAFQGCVNATGTVVVDAQSLTSYTNAFANVSRTSGGQVSLTGTCPLLAELAATKVNGNVVVAS